MGKVWERPGRGHGSELFVFLVFPWFFAVWPKTSRTQKEKFRPIGKVWAIHTQTKKPKNQKTKKPRNQKTKKPKNQKNQKNQDCTPQGEGVRCRVLGLVFLFFLFFWFFGLCVDSHCRCAKQKLPGTVSGCTRGRASKNQKTKKPKNQKTKKTKKTKIAHHKGRGSDAECWVLFFWFFCFFWFVCG